MDSRSQEYFDKILAKDSNALTDEDKAFLRARSSYLKKAQLKEYDSILNPEAPIYVAKKDQTSDTETVKPNAKTNTE